VIASDLMFFVAMVGAYLVLRAGNRSLFLDHVSALDARLGLGGVIALAMSGFAMLLAARCVRGRTQWQCVVTLLAAILAAGAYVRVRAIEYYGLLNHHTVVARDGAGGRLIVYDGGRDWWNGDRMLVISGASAPVPDGFDPHVVSERDVMQLPGSINNSEFTPGQIFQDVRYGPAKNIFFAAWYTITGAYLVHVLICIPLMVICLFTRRKSPELLEAVALFWQFIVCVGIGLFPLLYLGA
jgi:heme/copper-type cytochrome/quinol oxidase subunit 3